MGHRCLKLIKVCSLGRNILGTSHRHDKVDVGQGVRDQRTSLEILHCRRVNLAGERISGIGAGAGRPKITFVPFDFERPVSGAIVKHKTLWRHPQTFLNNVLWCFNDIAADPGIYTVSLRIPVQA